jgi:hypothetical protein
VKWDNFALVEGHTLLIPNFTEINMVVLNMKCGWMDMTYPVYVHFLHFGKEYTAFEPMP